MNIKKCFAELESKLFSNIDEKIKKIALIYVCVITVLGCILGLVGIIMIFESVWSCLMMLLYALVAIVSGYVTACLIYGFGTIVAKHVDKDNESEENKEYDNPVDHLLDL